MNATKTKTRGEYYNIEDAEGIIHKVLVLGSIQHTPYERHLTVTPAGYRRMASLPGPIRVASPTPYHPRAIFHAAD
jgi:hypothetical protein